MTIKFRNQDKILTLWVEKIYDDGWAVGWCPELKNTISVNPNNLIGFPDKEKSE